MNNRHTWRMQPIQGHRCERLRISVQDSVLQGRGSGVRGFNGIKVLAPVRLKQLANRGGTSTG